MRRAVVLLSVIVESLVVAACSFSGPDDAPPPKLREAEPSSGRKNGNGVSPRTPEEPSEADPAEPSLPSTPPSTPDAPAAPSTPPSPSQPVCALGNGLYCGGHGVPGKTNELYRCIDGVPVLEKVCDFECARMPDGKNDVCSCAFGNGLYCGGNGVNGDSDKLYRCTNGVVTLEAVCAAGCETRPNGYDDRCF